MIQEVTMTTRTAPAAPAVDQGRLEAFINLAIGDMAAIASGALTLAGHRLGLFRAMAGAGPLTPAELAERTGTRERYVLEWLNAQAAGGYVKYDRARRTYELPAEQAVVLADPDSPFFLPGGYDVLAALWADAERMADRFRSGEGMGWHEHDHRLFSGTEAFFRPGYRAHLAAEWIPSLDGVEERLSAGGTVADVGCGHGASTIAMAQAYPRAIFLGVDSHAASIDTARERAREAGVADRVRFETARAKELPGKDFDLVCFFDCLHDLGDPIGAAKRAREALRKGGTLMVVEPAAADKVEENLNPLGRLYYSASTFICTPNSLSQEVGLALGAQAGQTRLTKVLRDAGFTEVRLATRTPFNMVLEAKKS
jgi:ubiquinone/menaquinone biosynthesis C-methylase UbiE